MTRLSIEVRCIGGHVTQAVTEAIELAERLRCLVTLVFNDTRLLVGTRSKVDDVVAEYHELRRQADLERDLRATRVRS